MDAWKVSFATLLVLILMPNIVYVDGSVSYTRDKCPGDLKENDQWDIEGCRRCTCLGSKGYTCSSCPVIGYDFDPDRCYKVSTKDKPYPYCCIPIICRDEEGFDENLLNAE